MADDRLTIRKITAERKTLWGRAAKLDGRSLNGWIRHRLDEIAAAELAAGKLAAGKKTRRKAA